MLLRLQARGSRQGAPIQQWFGGVHADVKGLLSGCRCRAWLPPLPCFAELFLISDSVDRSISAAAPVSL